MKARGRIKELIPGLRTSTIQMVMEVKSSALANYLDKDLSIDIEPYSASRTLTMNAYYWKLLTMLARDKHINRSVPAMHNMMLIRYQPIVDTYNGQTITVYYDADVDVYEFDRLHLMPTTGCSVSDDGKLMFKYQVLKGSHEFTKKQFTALLDGLIDECKQVGIEVLPQHELDKIKQLYER